MTEKRQDFAPVIVLGLWLLFVIVGLTGFVLSRYYVPEFEGAYASVSSLRQTGWLSFVQGIHYFGSAALIVGGGVSVLSLLWLGRFGWADRHLWWSCLLAALCAVGFQMTGNLLPASAHDVRTAFTEASIVRGVPWVGQQLSDAILAGSEVSTATFERWYMLHSVVVPILALVGALIGVRGGRRALSSASLRIVVAVPTLVVVVMALSLQPPLGAAATAGDSMGGTVQPMWHVLPMHSLLVAAQGISPSAGWVGAIGLPVLLALLAAAMPIFVRGRKGVAPRPFGKAIAICGVVVLLLCALSFSDGFQGVLDDSPPEPLKGAGDEASSGPIDARLAKVGASLAKKHCLGCHLIRGEGHKIGPELSHVGRRRQNAESLVQLLRDPAKFGGTIMPSFSKLGDDNLRALAEYLRSLR